MKPSGINLKGKAFIHYQAVLCQKLRKEKGLSLRQIAGIVGLSAMTVWRRLKVETPYSNPYRCNFAWRTLREEKT